MIRHIVLLKCKADASAAEIEAVFTALAALQETIPGILAFESGENTSTEGKSRGYTHGFTMDFADEQARQTYLPHPDHEKVKLQIRRIVDERPDSVLVLDFPIEDTETRDVYQTS
jgi:heme-degrading monooxygenase HmoA